MNDSMRFRNCLPPSPMESRMASSGLEMDPRWSAGGALMAR
jgi:hypothetical protein